MQCSDDLIKDDGSDSARENIAKALLITLDILCCNVLEMKTVVDDFQIKYETLRSNLEEFKIILGDNPILLLNAYSNKWSRDLSNDLTKAFINIDVVLRTLMSKDSKVDLRDPDTIRNLSGNIIKVYNFLYKFRERA